MHACIHGCEQIFDISRYELLSKTRGVDAQVFLRNARIGRTGSETRVVDAQAAHEVREKGGGALEGADNNELRRGVILKSQMPITFTK